MLSRHAKTSQVKCNFCLEWMSIINDAKFKISVCDTCLNQASQENALNALSGTGQLYNLYIIKHDGPMDLDNRQKLVERIVYDFKQDKTLTTNPFFEESEKQNDEQQKFELNDVKIKWNILTNFLNEKQTLSSQQLIYLKQLIKDRPKDLKSIGSYIRNTDITVAQNKIEVNKEANIFQQISSLKINLDTLNTQKQNLSEKQQNPIETFKIKVSEKQNSYSNVQNGKSTKKPMRKSQIKERKSLKTQIPERTTLKSPRRSILGQKDLNTFLVSECKLSGLKENNYTPCKGSRLNTTSCFDTISNLGQSHARNSFYFAQSCSTRSPLGKSNLGTASNRLNSEELKKLEIVRNRISKYLEKNYESNSLTRLMFSVVWQAYENTSVVNKSIELISYNLSFTDFRCYLQAFDWSNIQVLKLVNTKLNDQQLKILIDFISEANLDLKVLVLTGNKLTQASIQSFYQSDIKTLKQLYLGKNRITKTKVRTQLLSLNSKYSLYL